MFKATPEAMELMFKGITELHQTPPETTITVRWETLILTQNQPELYQEKVILLQLILHQLAVQATPYTLDQEGDNITLIVMGIRPMLEGIKIKINTFCFETKSI